MIESFKVGWFEI
jgi:serine/threonine protein kinase